MTTPEYTEEQERANVRYAKWSILHDGKVLPVTNLYDSDSEETTDWVLACRCVCYDKDAPNGNWITLYNLDPCDLWIRTDADQQSTYEAGRPTREIGHASTGAS